MKTVIEIKTARLRKHGIKIDGKLYELRHASELSYLDGKAFKLKAARLSEIEKLDSPSAEERQEHERLAVEVCVAILDAPAKVTAKLTNAQHCMIVNTFFVLLIQAAQALSKTRKR